MMRLFLAAKQMYMAEIDAIPKHKYVALEIPFKLIPM